MGTLDLLDLARTFGPAGLFVFYLIQREAAERRERREQAEAQRQIAEKDIASRERLSSSLTALSIAVQGRANV